jgi:hypothetical protein
VQTYDFDAELWQWQHQDGPGSWYFVTMPADLADDVRHESGPPAGFGSVRVEVRIGDSTWRTSLFPQKESGSFVLPVKKPVRIAEGLEEGDPCSVSLRVLGG